MRKLTEIERETMKTPRERVFEAACESMRLPLRGREKERWKEVITGHNGRKHILA